MEEHEGGDHELEKEEEELGSSSLSNCDEMLLNLEFTLGRSNWQTEYAGSSKELITILRC